MSHQDKVTAETLRDVMQILEKEPGQVLDHSLLAASKSKAPRLEPAHRVLLLGEISFVWYALRYLVERKDYDTAATLVRDSSGRVNLLEMVCVGEVHRTLEPDSVRQLYTPLLGNLRILANPDSF